MRWVHRPSGSMYPLCRRCQFRNPISRLKISLTLISNQVGANNSYNAFCSSSRGGRARTRLLAAQDAFASGQVAVPVNNKIRTLADSDPLQTCSIAEAQTRANWSLIVLYYMPAVSFARNCDIIS